ncbi:MAG: hypothetical protein EP340_08215 [Alphaproteobacteria bacterium]|nr:MAG: hypothetical protein EP340_08215 [Alphaproteobacteria bacterium]
MSATLTLAITAPVETLWVLLGHEIRAPGDYASQATLFSCQEVSKTLFKRSVSRAGTRFEEEIEINPDALMVEQTWTAPGKRPLKLILQLVPMGEITLLNLAANLAEDTEEALTDPDLPDLMELARNIQKMAQTL